MNAYELADKLNAFVNTDIWCPDKTLQQASIMLRQQADRIAELEKVSSKPVAWWTGKFDDECEDFMFPDTRQAHIDHPQSETHNFFPIPLYTHPHKELSDEEIMKHFSEYWNHIGQIQIDEDFLLIAIRAIIKASRGEE